MVWVSMSSTSSKPEDTGVWDVWESSLAWGGFPGSNIGGLETLMSLWDPGALNLLCDRGQGPRV